MEQVTTTPKTRKPRAKANVKEQMAEPTLNHTLEQPKVGKPRAKADHTLAQPKTRRPIAKVAVKEQIAEHTLEQPKAKAKAKAKAKGAKPPILQSEKVELFREKSKLRQLKDAERIYNNAIKQLQK